MVGSEGLGTAAMPPRSQQAQRLAKLVNYLIAGARHIERQRSIIMNLERDDHDTTEARRALKQLEELHAIYTHDKDRIIDELAQEPESAENTRS
jgi:hypothetical protein